MAVAVQNHQFPDLISQNTSAPISSTRQLKSNRRSEKANSSAHTTLLSRKTSQDPMSFTTSMKSFAQPTGVHSSALGSLPNPNGALTQSQTQNRPSIYTAVYSGISVYEMEVNKVAVMRRRSDSCLNATQILKVAGVDKGKRTKILEKEILSGQHEKVQGGYGKYQGTWISYQRGREFCKQYGVEELLRPLLEYDMGQDGTQAGNGNIETPTKEQAMAAQRKQMMYNGTAENRPAQTPNGTFFKKISSSAVQAIQAINKSRVDSPGPRPGSGNKRPPNVRGQSSQESNFGPSSQQSMRSLHSEGSFGINGQLDSFGGNQNQYYTKHSRTTSNMDGEPPRKRARPDSSHGIYGSQNTNGDYSRSMRDTTPTEANESFAYQQYSRDEPEDLLAGLKPLPAPTSHEEIRKKDILCSLFLDHSLDHMRDDFSSIPSIDGLHGEDLDIPIDATCHTALHWAATLARPSLVRALIAKGASIYRVNSGGETALMRAALTTNNFEQNHFSELLELLGPTIEMRDARGRTVLHHIAIASAIKGRNPACRYYLETLLEFVCRQGSANNSQQNSFAADQRSKQKSIGLARFMSEIVNAQDGAGDTALNMAARINNKSIVRQLREIGGNPAIPNRGGLKPNDFGIDMDLEADTSEPQQSSQTSIPSSQKTLTENRTQDTAKEFLNSFTSLLNDTQQSFQSELQAKQSQIDSLQKEIRTISTTLTDARKEGLDLESKVSDLQSTKHQIGNLRRSNEEKRLALSNSGSTPRDDVTLGDADSGLSVDLSRLPPLSDMAQPLTAEQEAYIDSLPPVNILEARLRAYETLNAMTEGNVQRLKGQSVSLERKLRKIVALCTGVEEGNVDHMADPLAAAVASEAGEQVETGRLRDFLRKVGSGEI